MLSKEQIEKIEGEIKSKNEQITILKKEVRELEDKIIESNIETAKLAFKDIKPGDKVVVITQGRNGVQVSCMNTHLTLCSSTRLPVVATGYPHHCLISQYGFSK